jgi:hypothetical protein
MSIFGKIMSTIFGGAAQAAPAAGGAPAAAGTPGALPAGSVDVTAILDKLADDHAEDLDWRKSIVDLMKLVGMDSSLSNRKELATELGYSGNTSDSATMNVWLHKQVIAKLASNGGKVPKELLD